MDASGIRLSGVVRCSRAHLRSDGLQLLQYQIRTPPEQTIAFESPWRHIFPDQMCKGHVLPMEGKPEQPQQAMNHPPI